MSISNSTLTQAQLQEFVRFNPETGEFHWIGKTATHTVIGALAGGLDSRGYWRIRLFGKPYAAHRLAWLYVYGVWPTLDIDHINRVRTDNRIANLRDVSRSVNVQNTQRTQLARGVRLHQSGRYEARIASNGKRKTIGYFPTEDEALSARALFTG